MTRDIHSYISRSCPCHRLHLWAVLPARGRSYRTRPSHREPSGPRCYFTLCILYPLKRTRQDDIVASAASSLFFVSDACLSPLGRTAHARMPPDLSLVKSLLPRCPSPLFRCQKKGSRTWRRDTTAERARLITQTCTYSHGEACYARGVCSSWEACRDRGVCSSPLSWFSCWSGLPVP